MLNSTLKLYSEIFWKNLENSGYFSNLILTEAIYFISWIKMKNTINAKQNT